MLQLLVGRGGGDEETATVTHGHVADHADARDGGVDYGNVLGELLFEDGVEVLGAADGAEGVAICQGAEDADLVGRLVLATSGHTTIIVVM